MKLENKSYKMNISIFQIKCMKIVSKAEYNSMEKRQDEILDEVRPIN